MCAANFNPYTPYPASYGSVPANRTNNGTRYGLYGLSALAAASMFFPARTIYRAGQDEFQQNGGKMASAIGNAAKKNPWTILGMIALGGTAATLVSKDSLNSQVPLGDRLKAACGGLGTNVISTFTELGAAGLGVLLALAGHDAYKTNGGKIGSAIASTLKRNPIGAAAFAGLAAISLWLEVKSAHMFDKAISGKAGTQPPPY